MGRDDPFRVTHEGAGNVVAVWRNAVMSVYIGAPTEQAIVRATQDVRAQFGPRKTKQLWFAHFIASEGIPDAGRIEKIRAAFMGLLRETSSMMQASANVIDGAGFAAAALRAAGAGLVALSRAPYPIKMMSTVREAATFLGKSGAEPSDAGFDPTFERVAGELLVRARRGATS